MTVPATGPISGNSGKVFAAGAELPDVTGWNLDDAADNQAYVSSSTGGENRRKPGNNDSSGSFTILLQQGQPPPAALRKGCIVAVELIIAGANKIIGDVIVDSRAFAVDVSAGALIEVVINFSQDGALTEVTA